MSRGVAEVPWPKRLRRTLRAHAIRWAIRLLAWLPFSLALAIGRWGGARAWALFPKDRELAMRHLRLAFPEMSDAEREAIARRMFVRLGEMGMELIQLRNIDRRIERYVELPRETKEILDEAIAGGKGAIIVTGHIGNWELIFRRCLAEGYDAVAVGTESHDPRLTSMIEEIRGKDRIIWRGRSGAAREMLRVFRRNGYLAMLIDQDTDVQGVFVPFFGRPAWTPRAAADLVQRTGAGVAALFIESKEGGGHRIRAHRVERAPATDPEQEVVELTAELTLLIEEEIRRRPQDWVWMHRRWKTRPPEEGQGE